MNIRLIFNDEKKEQAKRLEAEIQKRKDNLISAKKKAVEMGPAIWEVHELMRKAQVLRPDDPNFDGSLGRYYELTEKRKQIVEQAERAIVEARVPLEQFLAPIAKRVREFLLEEAVRLDGQKVAEAKSKGKTRQYRDRKIKDGKDTVEDTWISETYTVRTNAKLIKELTKNLRHVAFGARDMSYEQMQATLEDCLRKIDEIDTGKMEEIEMTREQYEDWESTLPSNVSLNAEPVQVMWEWEALKLADEQKLDRKMDELKQKARK